jgi:drug/metabolite transporter (DMT)-like permease
MNSAIAYALGAMLCFAIGDLIYKRGGAAGVLPHHLLMVQSWVFLPSVAFFGFVTNTLQMTAAALWGCLVGVFMAVGFYNFAHSLRSGSISVNAPIFRLSFVITALLAVILFGEQLNLFKVVAIGLAIVAVWLLMATPVQSATRLNGESRFPLLRVMIATASVGIGNVIYKFGLQAGATPASLIVAQAAVVVTTSTALTVVKDRHIRPSFVTLRYASAAAIVLAIAFALLLEGLAHGDASVVVPIAQMGFGVTALVGFLFLREPITVRKGLGLLSALASLATFAFSLQRP